jgi:hypothetical protein
VLDGDIVRRLEVGQVAYVYRGGVTFLQIKRLTGKQAAIGPGVGSISAAGLAGGVGRRAGPAGGDAGWLAGVGASTTGTAGRAGPGAGWRADPAASGEPPTIPLPVIGAAPGSRAGSPPGTPGAGALASGGPALPDVSEVLDEAFGVRRD